MDVNENTLSQNAGCIVTLGIIHGFNYDGIHFHAIGDTWTMLSSYYMIIKRILK